MSNLPEPGALELHSRLKKFAVRMGFDPEAAADLASAAYLSAFAAGIAEWHFASVCLKNAAIHERRNRRRRNLDYEWTFFDGEDEPQEIQRLATPANQIGVLEARDALATIDALPEPTRGLMRLMATEHTQQEAAAIMGLPIEEVRWRIALGRHVLREAMGRALGVRGHPHFVGVRKDCRKWVASIRQGRRYYHLGYYDTDELAAYAYDLKARELGVPEAKLNFPIPA